MSQFNLLKGTQAEYNTKKDKIADGSLVMVKENNDSLTGSLYIKDGTNNIRVSTDDAVTGFIYTNGQAIASKANGKTAQVLQVDSTLSAGSSHPVQNGAVAAAISGVNSGINTALNRVTGVETRATNIETDVSGIKAWQTVAAPSITDNGANITKMWDGAKDFGKSIRTIANEELAAQLLTSVGNDNFTDLQALATWLDEHPDDAVTMNAAIQNLDLTKAEARQISQSDYDNLSEAEKNNGTIYLIYDANDFINATVDLLALTNRVAALENNKTGNAVDVAYSNSTSGLNAANVQTAIDLIHSNHNQLAEYVNSQLSDVEYLLSQI